MKEENNKVDKVFETVEDKEKELDINDEVCPRIEKYPDLPEDEFIPIEYIHKKKGKLNQDPNYQYLINKKGEIKRRETGKITKGSDKNSKGYCLIHLRINKYVSIGVLVHVLVANTFLLNPNSEKYTVVNHIDHCKINNNLTNLEFTTIKGNNCKKLSINEEKLTKYIGYNESSKEVITVTSKNNKGYSISSIIRSIKENKKYSGLFWKRTNKYQDRESFYKKINFSGNLDDYIWFKHPLYENLWVCKEGFIKRRCKLAGKKEIEKIVGSIKEDGYVFINYCGRTKFVHTIILEYILDRYLKKDEFVDHINCIRHDNSFDNLRLSNSKDNMNNKLTLENKRRKITIINLFGDVVLEGVGLREAYEFIFDKNLPKCYKTSSELTGYEGRIYNNKYICFSEKQDKLKILKKLDRVYFLVSETTIEYSLSVSSIIRKLKIGRKKFNEFFKNGKPINGYKILKGLEAKDILIANGHLNILKELQTEKDTINKNQIEEK